MGAAVSTNAAEMITDSATKSSMNATSNCAANSSAVQKINISKISGVGCDINISGINQVQTTDIKLSCANSAELATLIKKDLDETLTQRAKSESAFSLSGAASTNLSKSIKKFVNESDFTSVANCIVDPKSTQDVNISDINCTGSMNRGRIDITDVNQVVNSKIVGDCVQKTIGKSEEVLKMTTSFSQIADSKNIALWSLGGCLGFCCICICSISVIMIASKGKGGKGAGGGGGGKGGMNPEMFKALFS